MSNQSNTDTSYLSKYTYGTVDKPLPFNPVSKGVGLSEKQAQIGSVLLILLFIILIFLKSRSWFVAWILGTVVSPIAAIFLFAILYGPVFLYYFYALPFLMIVTGILSAVIGLIVSFRRKRKMRREHKTIL